mgnify:CR=1 FL=1
MFGIGAQEMLLILLASVLLFGAKRIPQIAKGLGQSVGEFRRGLKDTS